MSEVGIFAGKVTLVLCLDEELWGALIHGDRVCRSKRCCQLCRLSKGISYKGENGILGLKA